MSGFKSGASGGRGLWGAGGAWHAALFVALAGPVSVFVTATASASNIGSTTLLDHEISVFYTSFAPNVGGLPEIGARYRHGYFEGEILVLNSIPAAEAGLHFAFDVSRFFQPHVTFGAAYAFGSAAGVTGAGATFHLFKLGPGEVSIGWDNYIYFFSFTGRVAVVPVIPLSLTYAF